MVVVGAGVRPDAMLAERAGLEVDDGIVCDSKLRDLGRGHLRGRRLLLLRQRRPRPPAAGRALGRGDAAGHPRRRQHARRRADYDVVPYFFSDLADWASLEYVGPAYEWDEEVWRGDRDGGEFSRLVPEGRRGRRRAQRRALRGPGPGPPPARDRRRRVRAPEDAIADPDSDLGTISLARKLLRATAPAAGYPQSRIVAPWCNGSTPLSGRGIRGSSPWGAVSEFPPAPGV